MQQSLDLNGEQATAAPQDGPPARCASGQPRVPRGFVQLARSVACHSERARWTVLYRVAWRLTHGEPQLLEVIGDTDICALSRWNRQVRRDIHKMKAFVRFRRCIRDGEEWFVAWHRPDHRIEQQTAPFFRDRFSQMRWCILTPNASLTWDLNSLYVGMGVDRDAAPQADELEGLWLTYYASIFNPARVKLKAMRAEMPVRHWPTLPETSLIGTLVAEAPARVAQMLRDSGEEPDLGLLRTTAI
jgi:DNA polymerase